MKKKKMERIIRQQRTMLNAQIRLESPYGPLMQCSFEHLYLMGLFGNKGDMTGWINGPIRFMVITNEN